MVLPYIGVIRNIRDSQQPLRQLGNPLQAQLLNIQMLRLQGVKLLLGDKAGGPGGPKYPVHQAGSVGGNLWLRN